MTVIGVDGKPVLKGNMRPIQTNKRVRKKPKRTNKLTRSSVSKPFQLYALLLEDKYYYVGLTSYTNASTRFKEHLDGGDRSAKWVKIHKPIKIIEVRSLGIVTRNQAEDAENKMTIEYMRSFGIHRVRGGAMCAVDSRINAFRFNEYS